MALKDVLEDKKKKRTITIVGTIVIILVTAGVFSYEASSIEVKEPPKEEVTTDEGTTTTPAAANETGSYHYENDGTIQGSSPCRILITGTTEPFPVEAGAKKLVVTVSSDSDIDLYIADPTDTIVESSTTAETTETIEITNPSPAGEWTAWITLWSTIHRPLNSANYHIVIDVYYE